MYYAELHGSGTAAVAIKRVRLFNNLRRSGDFNPAETVHILISRMTYTLCQFRAVIIITIVDNA